MKNRLCFREEVAPEVTPEVPVYRYYRCSLRKYRPGGMNLLKTLGKLFWVGRKYRPLVRYYRSRVLSFLAVDEFFCIGR